ncbi:MAG: extracellular solute-binding protein, partial [Chloroflexota bacterium]
MQDTRGAYDRRAFLKLTGAAALIAACDRAAAPTAAPASTSAATTAPAARPTGRIAVYSALDESTNRQLIAAFKAAHAGTDVDLLPLAPAGELQTRIRVEKASPKADIFVGGDSSLHDVLGREGLLAKYSPPNASGIAAEAKDPSGYWTGWHYGILGFVSNTPRLTSEVGGRKPRTWDDLLDPAWKGRLVLPDPLKTVAGYTFLAAQIFRFNRDEGKAMDFMKELHPQIARYVARTPQGIELVSQG